MMICCMLPISQSHVYEKHDIWSANCPWGEYYTDIDGSGSFLYIHIESTLGEGYVIKYLEGDQLKTLILPSTGETEDGEYVRLHLVQSNITGYFSVNYQITDYILGDGKEIVGYDIYIPDPKVYG